MSSDSESNVEMKSTLQKKIPKKITKTHSEEILKKEPKKLTTKEMIHSALEDLKSRKGTSLYAIKKYIIEKYTVDTDKINFYIKKYIKQGVESGILVQTKGIGASGSFKLAPAKKKTVKPAEKTEKSEKIMKKPDKEKAKDKKSKTTKKSDTKVRKEKTVKEKSSKPKAPKEKAPKQKAAKEKIATEPEDLNVTKQKKMKIKNVPEKKKTKDKKEEVSKTSKDKSVNKSIIRRKSIGSIIKPPKMKPTKT